MFRSLVIFLMFPLLLGCSMFVKPDLYELDINDPLYEKKALYNRHEIERARLETEYNMMKLNLWL